MPNPIAPSLFADPRVAQAKQLLRAALADHQKQLTGIRPPNPDRKLAYDELLQLFARSRGANMMTNTHTNASGNRACATKLWHRFPMVKTPG